MFGHNSGRVWPVWVAVDQHLPKSDPNWQVLANIRQIGIFGPNLLISVDIDQKLAQLGQLWLKLVRVLPSLGKLCQTVALVGQT